MAEERVQRRLAAIVAADVVGYSRLMGEDDQGTLQRLKALRSELFDPKVAEHGGRIFKTTGDGILIEFPSAVNAVQHALDVQDALVGRNADIAQDNRIELRIGVNLGDILAEEDDIYGDGVNVAARLETLCQPGEVYVSASVRDQVEGKLEAAFEDLGEQSLKNIERAVRVYRVVAGGRATTKPGTGEAPALPDKPSIAVLPFQNMSGDAEQEYFSDGITEDIITALSRVRWFFVTARNSTFAYKGTAPDIRQVATDLGVRYVLEGSVRKAGSRVRISAQLIDGATGNHVWAERYDRELADIFEVQDEITRAVVGAIEPELGRAEQERARGKPPESLRARDVFQRGMWHLNRRSEDDLEEALRLFRQAIAEAPGLAVAHAGAGEACFFQISSGYADARGDAREALRAQMLEFGRRAVELDNQDAFTHLALGRALNLQGDNEGAIAELETAVRLNPSSAQAHYALGWAMIWGGRATEGISHVETAMRLSPHDPYFGQFLVRMSEANLVARRPEEAIDWARRSLRQPNTQTSRWVMLAVALAHTGRIEEARQALESLQRLAPGYDVTLARDIFRFGDPETRDYFLDGLRKADLPE